jgi:hypothetical protein
MSDSEYEYSSDEEEDNEDDENQMKAIRIQRARQFEEQRARHEAKTPEYRQFVRGSPSATSSSGQTLGDSNSKVNMTLSKQTEREIEQSVIDEFWEDSTNRGRWHKKRFANIQTARDLIAIEELANLDNPGETPNSVIVNKKIDIGMLQSLFEDRKRERLEHMKEQEKIQRVAMAKRRLDCLDARDPAYRHKARRLNDIIRGKAYHKNTTLIF